MGVDRVWGLQCCKRSGCSFEPAFGALTKLGLLLRAFYRDDFVEQLHLIFVFARNLALEELIRASAHKIARLATLVKLKLYPGSKSPPPQAPSSWTKRFFSSSAPLSPATQHAGIDLITVVPRSGPLQCGARPSDHIG